MKCSYCGNELERGADFCPECGMILGLNESREEKKSEAEEPEFRVPEYTPNVFRAIDTEEEEASAPAMELEGDTTEQTVPVTENIPEYVSQVPEYVPAEFEDISSTVPEAEEPVQTEVEPEPEAFDAAEEELVAPEYVPAPDMPSEDDLDIRVPEQEITYPEYEKYKNAQAENEVTPTEEEYEEIDSDDIYVEPAKRKNGVLAVFLVIAVLCIIVGGVYAVKNILPAMGGSDETTTTEAQQAGNVSEEDSTEAEDTMEEDTTEAEDTTETEDTTEAEEDTTESEDTTLGGDVSEDETTTEEVTEEDEESTTAPVTTEPVTEAPSTTKPVTTAPSTTKPAATKPSTTKPANTDPYGINDVEVKKPAKYGKAYTLYCTAEGVILRSGPSKSSERVLYLSKGADLTAYAEENGYCYVRSNRYGVYGWVSASYTSDSRPEAETTKVTKNTVSPDKKYSKAETKYTLNGLNLRKGPGTDYDVITLIPQNYPVKVIGYKSGVSGWVYVTDLTYGYSGWVSSAYIK